MSKSHELKHLPKTHNTLYAFIGVLGLMLIFAAIIIFAYLPTRPGPADEDIVAKRITTLGEVRAKQRQLITSYEWVDKEAGVVRIPVERAMELTVKEFKKEGLTDGS